MKVNVRGNNPITSDQFKEVIDELNKEYGKQGLVVKNATLYVRFQDETDETVEPLYKGMEIEKTFTYKKIVGDNDKNEKK